MGTTPILTLPYPEPTDSVGDGDDVIKALALQMDAVMGGPREQPNGVAGLDAAGLLYSNRLPDAVKPKPLVRVHAVNLKLRSAEVATLNIGTHNLVVGQNVAVNLNDPADTSFNGSVVLTAVTVTAISYAQPGKPDVTTPPSSTPAPGGLVTASTPTTPVGQGELVFRVTDPPFLANPDGATNTAAAITAAGAAAAAALIAGNTYPGGAVVEFPYTPQGYAVTTLPTLYAGVEYRGIGHVLIKRTSATNGTHIFDCTGKPDITITGFTFDPGPRVTSGAVICFTRTKVRDNVFLDTAGTQYQSMYPVNFAGGTTLIEDVQITKNRFVGCRNNVQVKGNNVRTLIDDNDFSGWSSTAIAIDGTAETSAGAGDGTCTKDLIVRWNRVHDVKAVSRAVTSKKVAANVATLTLATAPDPGWVVGATIYADVNDATYDGNHTITAVSGNDVSWAKTAANSGPTASTGYISTGNRQPMSIQHDALDETYYHERVLFLGNQILGNYVNHQATAAGGTADCISIHHTKGITVVGNQIEGGGDCGITLSAKAWRATVTGNTLIGLSNAGIACGSTEVTSTVRGLTVTGNTIVNCGQAGSMGSWAACAVNLRRVTGAVVSGNYFGDDQAVPTMSYGISVGDTVGTSSDILIGPNLYVGLPVAKRLTPAGNVRLVVQEAATTVTKPGDTPLTLNSAALQDDPHLTFTMEGNGTYEITVALGYTTNAIAGATPGISVGITVPATSTATWWADTQGATGGTGGPTVTINSNRAFLTATTSVMSSSGNVGATPARMILTLRVVCAAAGGAFTIKAAQLTADATNATIVKQGSLLTQRRVA